MNPNHPPTLDYQSPPPNARRFPLLCSIHPALYFVVALTLMGAGLWLNNLQRFSTHHWRIVILAMFIPALLAALAGWAAALYLFPSRSWPKNLAIFLLAALNISLFIVGSFALLFFVLFDLS